MSPTLETTAWPDGGFTSSPTGEFGAKPIDPVPMVISRSLGLFGWLVLMSISGNWTPIAGLAGKCEAVA